MTRFSTRPVHGGRPLLAHRPPLVWLSEGIDLVGWGEAFRLDLGTGPDRFRRAAAAWEEWTTTVEVDDPVGLPGTGPIAFVSATFDDRSSGSVLVVPEVVLGRSGDRWFETSVDGAGPVPRDSSVWPVDRPRYAGASIPDVAWLEAVAAALDLIEGGVLSKVVLARDYAVWSKVRFDPRRILERLRARFPECFVFSVDGLVGASPELLIRRFGSRVESVPLAGSIRRSPDAAEDARLGRELLCSDKDRAEHEMAAASVGRVLERICDHLERSPVPELLRLANVQHLATRFEGRMSRPVSVLELTGLLHPTAAVGGVPSERAVEVIRRLEGMDRGRYAGPVGWIDRSGQGEMAIALRCAELSGARARLFAGAGIVAGSLPESELEETRLKLEAMLTALG